MHTVPSEARTSDGTVLTMRRLREQTGCSQRVFAAALGVSAETYRTWDSGRRAVPLAWMEKARALAAEHAARQDFLTLPSLARELGVHRRTLEAAVRDGRLEVCFSSRSVFGRPLQLASLAAGRQFKRESFGRCTPGLECRRPALPDVPSDYAAKLRGLRLWLGLTLGDFAHKVGAAGKAVVYQWESGKRRPSPVFWQRIEGLVDEWHKAPRP